MKKLLAAMLAVGLMATTAFAQSYSGDEVIWVGNDGLICPKGSVSQGQQLLNTATGEALNDNGVSSNWVVLGRLSALPGAPTAAMINALPTGAERAFAAEFADIDAFLRFNNNLDTGVDIAASIFNDGLTDYASEFANAFVYAQNGLTATDTYLYNLVRTALTAYAFEGQQIAVGIEAANDMSRSYVDMLTASAWSKFTRGNAAQFAKFDLNTADGMAAVASSGYNCGWEVWVDAFGSWSREDFKNDVWASGGRTGGYAGYDADLYGVNLGVVKNFSNFGVGLSFGYGYGDVSNKGGFKHDYNVDNWSLALHLGANFNNFFVNGTVGYQWNRFNNYEFNTFRYGTIGTIKANDFNGHTWFAALKAGYDFHFGCWTITPSVGWNYVNSSSNDFNANYLDSTDTFWNVDYYATGNYYSSRLPIMLRVNYAFGGANNLYLEGGYIREFHSAPASANILMPNASNNTAYWQQSQARTPSQNFGNFNLGYNGNSGRFDYGAQVGYLFNGSKYDNWNARLTFGVRF